MGRICRLAQLVTCCHLWDCWPKQCSRLSCLETTKYRKNRLAAGAPPRPRYGSIQRSHKLPCWCRGKSCPSARNPDLRRRGSVDLLATFRQLAHCREPSTCHGRRALSDACPDLTLPAVDIRNLVRKWATVMRPPATSTVVTCFILRFGERDIIAVIQHRAVVYFALAVLY